MKRKVIMDQPGVVRCGPYEAGKEYEVDAEEARRLVEVKSFRYVNDKPVRSEAAGNGEE